MTVLTPDNIISMWNGRFLWLIDSNRTIPNSRTHFASKFDAGSRPTSSNTSDKKPLNSQAMIKEKLSDSLGDDVSVTCLRVSLICPVGKSRMVVPCRGGSCEHLQCFDAPTYFKLNQQRPRWRCPVCDRPCPKDALVIDTFLQDILQKDTASTEVVIHKDRSWSTQKSKENGRMHIALEDSSLKSTEVLALISSSSISHITPESVTETNPPEAVTDFIDLTVDSSDDDDVKFIRFSPPKTRKNRNLFKRKSDPHPYEIQARNLQDMSAVDFDNFLIDLGLVLYGKKRRNMAFNAKIIVKGKKKVENVKELKT